MMDFLKKIPGVTVSLLEMAVGGLLGLWSAYWRHNQEYADQHQYNDANNHAQHQEISGPGPADQAVGLLAGVGFVVAAKALYTGTKSLKSLVTGNAEPINPASSARTRPHQN